MEGRERGEKGGNEREETEEGERRWMGTEMERVKERRGEGER